MNSRFLLKKKFSLDKPNNRIDFVNDSPTSLTTINTINSSIATNFPREDA